MGLPSFNAVLQRFISSRQLLPGDWANGIGDQLYSTQTLTAFAGGGKASATQINAASVKLATVATAADSVKLPLGYAGLEVFIANAGAASAQVFGSGTDTINGVATGTGVPQANGVSAIYKCIVGPTAAAPAAQWFRVLSA